MDETVILEEQCIEGLFIIKSPLLCDSRGSFLKRFNYENFSEAGISDIDFKESYHSVSCRGVIRGMHYQASPMDHGKLVSVSNGSIVDVVLDLRESSKSYGKIFSTKLSSSNGMSVYIPRGCAHGFKSLEDNTIVEYLQTSVYDASLDCGIYYDSFGYDWGEGSFILSERDKSFKKFNLSSLGGS